MSDVKAIAARYAAAMKAAGGLGASGGGRPVKSDAARRLEALGWERWLRTLGSRTFTGSFSEFHADLWGWYWEITHKRLRGEPLTGVELAFLAVWFRGGGKSSHVEWACIAEGACLGEGFVMYVCDTEAQAKGHVAAIRTRLESSEVAAYYPGLARPEISKHGAQVGWRQDYLATASGWGIIPVGLDQGVRGGRKDDLRFTMIVLDDIDDIKDSPAAVEKKLDIISRSILPAGQADTLVLFAQNLIHEGSVLNQIVTRRSDVLSERRVSGPVPAFEKLELRDKTSDQGLVWEIKSATPTWPDIDMDAARRYLSKSGRSSFLAEYNHDFAADRAELVLYNWDDDTHVITVSEFERVFGARGIPDRWYKYVAHDWARTKSAYHANVAGVVAVSGQSEKLPGVSFLHDCMSFAAATEPDDVALRLLKTIAPRPGTYWEDLFKSAFNRQDLERYVPEATQLMAARRDALARVIPPIVQKILSEKNFSRFRMSHERPDLQKLYREVYGLPFRGVNPGKDGGIEVLNHYMAVDTSEPHPFKPGRMGYSRFYLIVPDTLASYPASLVPDRLHDSQLARYQFKHWRNAPLKLNEMGVVERGPVKINDDFGQALQMLFFDNRVRAAPLTEAERKDAARPASLQAAAIAALPDTEAVARAVQAQHFFDVKRASEKAREEAEGRRRFGYSRLFGRGYKSPYRRG